MKDKHGFLLGEETLKIILAVISIGFLIYFLGALYYNGVKDKELDLAKASLEHLVEEINAGATEVEIYNPKGWVILSKDDLVCICETPFTCEIEENCMAPNKEVNIPVLEIINPPVVVNIK